MENVDVQAGSDGRQVVPTRDGPELYIHVIAEWCSQNRQAAGLGVLVSPHNQPLFPSAMTRLPLLCRFHRACILCIGRGLVVKGRGVSWHPPTVAKSVAWDVTTSAVTTRSDKMELFI